LLIVLAAVNYRGTRIGGRFQATINLLKLAILAVLIGWSFFGPCGGSVRNRLPFAGRRGTSDVLLMAIAGASINAFFSFGGWWDVTKLAGEIRDPRRTLPRAMVLGIAAVTLVYVGLSAAFLYVVPIETVVSHSAFVAQFGEALFGRFGANVLSICVLVSVLGGLAVLMMAAPRVYYAMALDGNFFRWFARLDSRYNTPGRAILLQLGCSLLILGLGALDKIIASVIFMAVLFLALTAGATFKLPRETKAGIWYPAAPILFIVCCGLVAAMILLRNPLQALLGCVVVAFGCPAFWLMKKPAKLQRSASSVTTISQQAGASVE
jgi:APA family basic amino acid/polyamine antiporter